MIDPEKLAMHLAQVQGRLDAYGYTMISVADEEEMPTYTYTIGLQRTCEHPDLIMFGIGPHSAQIMLAGLANRIKAGERIASGATLREVANMPLIARKCDRQLCSEFVSQRFGDGFDYLQIVWPDERWLHPWQKGFDQSMAAAQPLLFDL